MNIESKIKEAVRNVPDFPKQGIMFKDITPIFQNTTLRKEITKHFSEQASNIGVEVIVGIESRGFLFGMLIADELDIPFIPIRKKGKLPGDTYSVDYDLEYGKASIEIQKEAIKPGQKILLHDDLLATGGTITASAELVRMAGGDLVGFSFLIELGFLNGREKLHQYSKNIVTLANY